MAVDGPQVVELAPGFRLHTIPGFISDLFLVEHEEDGRFLLLDAGCAADFATAKSYFTGTLGHPAHRLNLVVATHAHPDHAGAAHLWQQHEGVPVAAPPRISQWYDGFHGRVEQRIDMALARVVRGAQRHEPLPVVMGKALVAAAHADPDLSFPPTLHPEHELVEGCAVGPGFEDWTVVPLPGHTSHMVGLLHQQSSSFYAADAVVHTGKQGFHLPFPIDFAPMQAQTLDRLAALPLCPERGTVMLAHGAAVPFAAVRASVQALHCELATMASTPPRNWRWRLLHALVPLTTTEIVRVRTELALRS